MNRLKLSCMAIGLAVWAGCGQQHMEVGGAYAGLASTNATGTVVQTVPQQSELYALDLSYKLSVTMCDVVFKWEYDNRAYLWKLNPDIKHSMDAARKQAQSIRERWGRIRPLLNNVAVPLNLTDYRTLVADAQAAAVTAQTITTKGGK